MCTHRWFLTDDQDQVLGGSFPQLGGVGPMPKTKRMMADMGATAENFYIHTPICCPSRSELVSGRYFHNIKSLPTDSKPDKRSSCMHVNEDKVNNDTFAKYLKEEANYTVGMFGKYLNNVPKFVPPGFDAWLANGGGSYLSPEFATWNIDGLPNGTWKGTKDNYTTAVVGNTSIAWIRKVVQEDPSRPFFAYVEERRLERGDGGRGGGPATAVQCVCVCVCVTGVCGVRHRSHTRSFPPPSFPRSLPRSLLSTQVHRP